MLADLFQSGCSKVRLPRNHSGMREAVVINTAGGLTDGDELSISACWGEGTSAVVTTQACERVYKARVHPARIDNEIVAGPGALACWLPQETILFDGGRLHRTMEVQLANDARLVACEAVILGRTAMGETVRSGQLFDGWHIERDDQLIFCDRLALEGDITAQLMRAAIGAGAGAFATLIYCGADSTPTRDALRPLLDGPHAACSDLGGVVLVRMLAPNGHVLRRMLMDAVCCMLQSCGAPAAPPRVWMV